MPVFALLLGSSLEKKLVACWARLMVNSWWEVSMVEAPDSMWAVVMV